jgi:hypothetical protein
MLLQVYRGGGGTSEKRRLHKRERFATEIALKLASAMHKLLGFHGV